MTTVFFFICSNDEAATEGILKCYQILSNSCGLLDLTFPRDAFIMSVCKASLPSQCSLSVLSVPSLDTTGDPKFLPSQASNLAEKSGATGSGFPTMVAGMAPGAQSGPVTVSSWGKFARL
jgi:hypothetical protein